MLSRVVVNDFEKRIKTCRQNQFTGVMTIRAQKERYWLVYSLLGRIVWIQSNKHSLRRWKRHLAICSPDLYRQIMQRPGLSATAWNYTALARLVKLKKLSQNKLLNVIESVVTEELFDILQVGSLQYQRSKQPLAYELADRALTSLPFLVINNDRAWREATANWVSWLNAGLAQCSPDWGLGIKNFEALRLRASSSTLQTLKACCNQKNTLRDLAVKFRQPIELLTKSMMPYLSEKMLTFIELPDLVSEFDHGFLPEETTAVKTSKVLLDQSAKTMPGRQSVAYSAIGHSAVSRPPVAAPEIASVSESPSKKGLSLEAQSHRSSAQSQPLAKPVEKPVEKPVAKPTQPLIVYVDDSLLDSRAMSVILQGLGCGYTNVSDPIQALPVLLELKPALIFLDLVMPVANGYEVCAQIRRISALKQTPVVIVTSNDGVADRARARLVGASGFLGKPIHRNKVAKVLKKHLSEFEFVRLDSVSRVL